MGCALTITVKTASDLNAALQRIIAERVDRGVAAATREVAVYAFTEWTGGKFTWSKYNPNDVWSGQSRQSVNIGIGSPDPSFAPDNPGSWPMHESPYPPRDPFEARFKLEGLPAYVPVYISDNAPNMAKVEAHTQVAHMAAAFTQAHFKPGFNWKPVISMSSSVPF